MVKSADGIPLDSYPASAAQNILALVRYRSAVPFMLAFLALSYLAGQLALQFVPLVRTGTPPGPIVNLVLFAMMIVGLALSLWKRHSPA